ncbi:MAG: CPBP family intramembrane glutamic endopeptidase [Terriglobales bacterium]|jgi:CAAX protease family protein
MTSSSQLKFAADTPPASPGSSPRPASRLKAIFVGPNGLRAGWRLLIFVVLVLALLAGFILIRTGGVRGFREARAKGGQVTVTPFLMGWVEAVAFSLLCVATLIMGKIERRKFSEYGLPLRQALGKNFWVGTFIGFTTISATLFTMFLLHGFRINGLALHGTAILSSLPAWGAAFLMAGLFEEFLDRGYLQYTLSSGIGFWPAAFLTSAGFAFGHVFNANETLAGLSSVVLFGLLLCLFLRRTGNLWCAVGFHAAYDWGQTLYGVSDSGIKPYHNLFNSAFSGPRWLTGGIVGPEASVITPIALVVAALIFSRCYRENLYDVPKARSLPTTHA